MTGDTIDLFAGMGGWGVAARELGIDPMDSVTVRFVDPQPRREAP